MVLSSCFPTSSAAILVMVVLVIMAVSVLVGMRNFTVVSIGFVSMISCRFSSADMHQSPIIWCWVPLVVFTSPFTSAIRGLCWSNVHAVVWELGPE